MSLAQWVAAAASDILSVTSLPGGSLLTEATRRVIERRLAAAREVWLEGMRRGNLDMIAAGAEDEVAAILFRYQRAAVEGTARLNLRLLASAAAGQSTRGGFAADDFLAWADALAPLRREELILVAEMRKAERTPRPPGGEWNDGTWANEGKWMIVRQAVIPDPFASEGDMRASAASAMRSGLVMPTSGTLDNPVSFTTTTRLDRLLELAPLADFLGRESRAGDRARR